MPLINLWKADPDTVLSMSIEQLVGMAGNGHLADETETSAELREFLNQVPSELLARYANECMAVSIIKDKQTKGFILQDIINEIGRRLEYTVTNGLYRGKSNKIGFDGLWFSPDGNSIVVETKTTDFYRINLDTIAAYREKLLENETINKQSSIIVVVGREDTGDLEAQIRGSKHAWDIRVISIDALIKLVQIKESTEEEKTNTRIRSLLTPFEYTKLDNIIETLFITATDVELSKEKEDSQEEIAHENNPTTKKQDFTDTAIINTIRKDIVHSFSQNMKVPMIAKSRALYWDPNHKIRIACTISKKYDGTAAYWYAYHPNWDDFLSAGDDSYFILGCVDNKIYFTLPHKIIVSILEHLNTTVYQNTGKEYWHIHIYITEQNRYELYLPKTLKNLDLTPYITSY